MTKCVEQAAGVLPAQEFDLLLGTLAKAGYELVGPTLRHGVIGLGVIERAEDLPKGVADEHAPGNYRVRSDGSPGWFGYVVGQESWKRYLFPPEQTLFRAERDEHVVRFAGETPETRRRALLGVRGCDVAAIAKQARVFDAYDPGSSAYGAALAQTFVVAIDCSHPAATCFCTSMGSGPAADEGFDLALTEIASDTEHYFVLRTGSASGRRIAEKLTLEPATRLHREAASAVSGRAVELIERGLDKQAAKRLHADHPEHPRWETIGDRCLSCGNCTMVCPTCFCSRREDTITIDGTSAEQRLVWDSCFNRDFSLAGGIVRESIASRYRQWMTHKLSTWHEQFGESGCVGCGRCITWCPAGIDITQELAAMAGDRGAPP